MTLRCILVILSFILSSATHAQLYRVFFHEKGDDLPIKKEYLDVVRSHCDSLWMHSNWLNYALVENSSLPNSLLNFEFVDHIEKFIPLQSTPLQKNENPNGDRDSIDPAALDEHRQWQLDTLGFQFFNRQKINGAGIVIAIIDAGFTKANESRAFQHIYAKNRVLYTYDFIDHDSDVYHGSSHGTSVWGLIGGNLDGKPLGLAQNSSFILLRSEDTQTETMADEDRWIQAIEKAYELGADVVNSSVGFADVLHKRSEVNGQTLISKAADMAAKKGMIVVISAGNEWVTAWKTLSVPADADGVIAVGGIDKQGKQSYFSSVGPTADGRAKPDVVAPGTCVIVRGNDLTLGSGTSFSSPLVAGYMACMLEWKGKGNFPKDSLKYYGRLYPYFDYVFGYGMPGTAALDTSWAFLCGFNKHTRSLYPAHTHSSPQNIVYENIRLKIVGKDGIIKFSKFYKRSIGGKLNVPKGSYQKFNYSHYYDEQDSDRWFIWWNGRWIEG